MQHAQAHTDATTISVLGISFTIWLLQSGIQSDETTNVGRVKIVIL